MELGRKMECDDKSIFEALVVLFEEDEGRLTGSPFYAASELIVAVTIDLTFSLIS